MSPLDKVSETSQYPLSSKKDDSNIDGLVFLGEHWKGTGVGKRGDLRH